MFQKNNYKKVKKHCNIAFFFAIIIMVIEWNTKLQQKMRWKQLN